MIMKYFFSGFILLGFLTTANQTLAADPSNMSIDDISACMRTNVFNRGSLRDFQITAVDREGKSKSLKMKVFWKPGKTTNNTRITLQVIEPDSLKGTAYLLEDTAEGEQLHLYLPAIRRVKSITGSEMTQKLWGSDFTSADIKQVQGLLLEGDIKRLGDTEIDGRPAYLLETKTNKKQTGYRMVRSYVDQQSCLLLKTELFSEGFSPHKVLQADISTMLEIDPWWLILGYRMTDNRAGTYTDLALSDIFIQERLPESLFTQEGFYKNQ